MRADPLDGLELVTFRFAPDSHTYTDLETGHVIPHITGMLERTGWVDDLWYTEESAERGTIIHNLTARYDLGAVDLLTDREWEGYRPYLLAHVTAVTGTGVKMVEVEVPRVHPTLRFGGRPDRVMQLARRWGVWEVKSAAPNKSHGIQTALQAILVEPLTKIPPEHLARYCCYLKPNGRFKVEEHINRRDFDEARRVIASCT